MKCQSQPTIVVHQTWYAEFQNQMYGNTPPFDGVTLTAVPVQTQPVFQPGTPQTLFTAEMVGTESFGNKRYDVAGDGQRFVVVQKWIREFEGRE